MLPGSSLPAVQRFARRNADLRASIDLAEAFPQAQQVCLCLVMLVAAHALAMPWQGRQLACASGRHMQPAPA